ncbi:hypothetical protein [Halogeometricum sp. CBA1124]|uniref:hypothetical protein n=1 Tax=Halogeometricum sp. CBA1124 TaxID=2668071 RepID=UPI00142CDD1A|nr:hypothetical protein [Halogeometricum sp. CBA1124]MUV57106.1 hypothetical protein [Halogeometricum sp. CBA1124]
MQTDSRGRYDAAVPADAVDEADNGSVTVVARYDGRGANLASAESRRPFAVGASAATGDVVGAADDVVSSWVSILFGDTRFGIAPFGADGNQIAVATGVLLIATLVGGTLYTGLREVGSPGTLRSDEATGADRGGGAVAVRSPSPRWRRRPSICRTATRTPLSSTPTSSRASLSNASTRSRAERPTGSSTERWTTPRTRTRTTSRTSAD